MSKTLTSILALAVVAATTAACAKREEEYVVVAPEPISVEPVYTGKFK